MRFDNSSDDPEAEPVADDIALDGVPAANPLFEDRLRHCRADPRTVVPKLEEIARLVLGTGDFHPKFLRRIVRKFDRVREEVEDDLLKLVLVDPQCGHLLE